MVREIRGGVQYWKINVMCKTKANRQWQWDGWAASCDQLKHSDDVMSNCAWDLECNVIFSDVKYDIWNGDVLHVTTERGKYLVGSWTKCFKNKLLPITNHLLNYPSFTTDIHFTNLWFSMNVVVWVEVWERHILRAQGREAALSVDGSASAGPSVLHGPCVGVTVAQAQRHPLAGATVHGHRFGNALPLVGLREQIRGG